FADVDGDGLAGVGHGEGLGLGFAQFGPVPAGVVFAGVVEVWELDPVEGEVALGELFAPAGDEGGEAHGVAAGVGGVGFALIPDDAAQGTGDEGGDHAVVEAAGGAVAGDAARGLGRGGLEGGAGGLGVGPGFFPLGAEGLVGGEFLGGGARGLVEFGVGGGDRKSTRLNSSHVKISYA